MSFNEIILKKIIFKPKITFLSLAVGMLIFIVSPYEFKLNAAIFLSIEALILWGASAMDNAIISVLFLAGATSLSLTPYKILFQFPATENFYLIILSYLITKGVTDTGTASVISKSIMEKIAKTPIKLIFFSYIAGFLLIFFIPQPFPRVILLAAFYREFFKSQNLTADSKEILYFSIFTASTFTSMFFMSGDMLLNYVVVAISGAQINWAQWALYMSLPASVTCILTFILFIAVFKKEIKNSHFIISEKKNKKVLLTAEQKKMFFICLIIFIGFASQSFHHMKSVYIMLIGVILGFTLKIIKPDAIKNINWKLLIFFTGAFSVGGVLNYSGAADIITKKLLVLVPVGNFNEKIIFLIIITLILNFFLGSAVTTSSVVIPTIAQLGILPPHSAVLTLFVYTVVSIQYILPFHHATVMVGFGEGLYGNKVIIKYGILLTVLTFFIVLYICIPWWKFIDIL